MNIIVLCGGLSAERDVSISSGTQIADALSALGHNVALVDLFFGYQEDYGDPQEIFTRRQERRPARVSDTEPDLEYIKSLRVQDNDSKIGDNIIEICRAADIVFLALHGEEGENGKLQAVFDIQGIKYTGSGYLGSALAMNKQVAKALFQTAGIDTPRGITVKRGAAPYENIGFPCVVKPCSYGSSVGTSIVQSADEYPAALEGAFRYEDLVIVEEYIDGREFTVGVFSGKAMPVIEIIPKTGFFDYKNKYQAGFTDEICPADIPEELKLRLQVISESVYEVLQIEVYCSIDYKQGTNGIIYCLEANTLPGMTPASLIPQMAAVMGLSYGELCEEIIRVSLEKYR